MANTIFNNLLREQINIFCAAFSETSNNVFYDPGTSRLRHPGEYGAYREAIVRDFMKFLIPRNLDISSGFIITATDKVSSQVDIVAFDAVTTPLYIGRERQRFFPVESVFCIGEVKSTLKKVDLKDALNKLAAVKRLSEEIPHPVRMHTTGTGQKTPFAPQENPFDLAPSFLLCQKFDFKHSDIVNELDDMYEKDVEHRHKHNFILSIEDGLLCYDSTGGALPFPVLPDQGTQNRKHRFVTPSELLLGEHLKFFAAFLNMVTLNRTRYIADFSNYIGSLPTIKSRNQS